MNRTKPPSKKLASRLGPFAIIAGMLLIGSAEKQQSALLGWIGFAIFAGGLFGSIWGSSGSPLTRAERQERFALVFGFQPGVNKLSQSIVLFCWFVLILGGPLLGIFGLRRYPPIDEAGWYPFFFGFWVALAGFFSMFKYLRTVNGASLSLPVTIIMLLGLGFVGVSFCFGLVLWVNGSMDRTMEMREISLLDKRASGGQNPSYYAIVRSWHDADRVYEIPIPRTLYESVGSDSSIRLTTGQGALSIEWLRAVDLVTRSH